MEVKIDAKRAAMSAATQSVLLADAGKFERFAKYRVAGLGEFDSFVTDEALPDEDVTAVRELGPLVVVA